jgi:hypothetical protein
MVVTGQCQGLIRGGWGNDQHCPRPPIVKARASPPPPPPPPMPTPPLLRHRHRPNPLANKARSRAMSGIAPTPTTKPWACPWLGNGAGQARVMSSVALAPLWPSHGPGISPITPWVKKIKYGSNFFNFF